MFDRVNTRKQACIHTCTSRFTTQLVSSRCLQAVLNTAVCTGFVQHAITRYSTCSICLMGPTIGIGTSMPDRCATRAVQLHLLAAISWFCVVSGCTGFVQHAVLPTQPGTGSMVCLTASTRRTSMHIYSTLFCCSDCAVAAAQAILITAACRVCAASRGIRLQACKVIQTDRTHQPGTLMSDSLSYWATCLAIYSYLLLSAGCCCNCLHRVCAAARYRLQGMSDCVNTREQAGIRALPCCAKAVQGKLVSCSCLQVNLATPDAGVCATCQYSQLQAAHCMLDR
jgi:hypothetical protein